MNKRIESTLTWIYSLADYKQMFDLSDGDLSEKIFDFPGGVSSFNAEMFQQGHRVVSGDTLYSIKQDEMERHAWQQLQLNEEKLRQRTHFLRSNDDATIQSILDSWRQNTQTFLDDYSQGKDEGRYQCVQLPSFPFEDHEFDLAFCHDILFHSQVKQQPAQQELISELCRVAHEVRVYPLHDENGEIAKDLGAIIMMLQENNFGVEVREVNYEVQKGGNAMLRIWAKECIVEE